MPKKPKSGCERFSKIYPSKVNFSFFLPRGVDLDLSWPPRAAKKNLMEGNLHHQMGQNFINFFSWVDIHGIYDIVENDNQNWKSLFFIKHTVSN